MSWDPRYAARSPFGETLRTFARSFVRFAEWPSVVEWDAAFARGPWADRAAVRFVPERPRPRRRRATGRACDPDALYDARIVAGEVPSRERSWHDFLNAHVWAAFPASKRALHARQDTMIRERIGTDRASLPRHRTPEQDAVAMVDEGSVLLLVPEAERHRVEEALRARAWDTLDALRRGSRIALLVFGHGIHEVQTLAPRPIEAMAIVLAVDSLPAELDSRLAIADSLLARRLSSRDRFRAPGEHPTFRLTAR